MTWLWRPLQIVRIVSTQFSGGPARTLTISGCNFSPQPKVDGLSSSLRFRPSSVAKKKATGSTPMTHRPSKDTWSVVGYTTAESYDLYNVEKHLQHQGLYDVIPIHDELNDTCICAMAKYNTNQGSGDHRQIFFFNDGSVIFWSTPELERETVLHFLRQTEGVELNRYETDTVFEESELMDFSVSFPEENAMSRLDNKGHIHLVESEDPHRLILEKFAFSNAMAASVKLGALEASLDRIIDSLEFLSEDMKQGRPVGLSRREVLKKTGELFALRHVLNLSSDLIDVPDFYWDRERLETMYMATCSHLAVAKRTRVTNERINHCTELLNLIRENLNDAHSTQLEWYIIILILVEVIFEIVHFAERYW